MTPPGPLWRPYTPRLGAVPPLEAVATNGARIRLADGRELIDGIASWWTACHGYNHPHIAAAVARQLAAMPHVMFGGLTHAPAETLGRRLAALLPGDLDTVFLCDSGSVAVEVALKMAVQHWRNRGIDGRNRFVCFRHAYHGDTLGAMSVGDPYDGMHRLFAGYLPAQLVAELPRGGAGRPPLEALLAAHGGHIAAIIVEPLVQAAGGMRLHDAATLAEVARLARSHDILLIADEIATGFGRTGRMFACQEAGVVPDIICLGKALTGGTMSLAAAVAGRRVADAFLSDDPDKALMHGPTFMANPLACAAANASLDLFETEPRLAQVAEIESHLRDALAPCRAIPGVVDLRVKGAIGAVELTELCDADWMTSRFVAEGVWLRPLGKVVYLMPPFIVSEAELATLTGAVVRVLGEWSARRGVSSAAPGR